MVYRTNKNKMTALTRHYWATKNINFLFKTSKTMVLQTSSRGVDSGQKNQNYTILEINEKKNAHKTLSNIQNRTELSTTQF